MGSVVTVGGVARKIQLRLQKKFLNVEGRFYIHT